MLKIILKWTSYRWSPGEPPDQAEYERFRQLSESAMKEHLKTLMDRERRQMKALSPYTYRRALILFAVALGVMMIAKMTHGGAQGAGSFSELAKVAGWLMMVGAVLLGGGASMTNDSIRKNLIVVREYYVRCWVAAQRLEFGPFQQHMRKLIARGITPDYDLL